MDEAHPVRFSVAIADGDIAGWRWRNNDAPPLLFCHATGFCASAYKQMLSRLASTFDVYAIDMRGHGRTALPDDPAMLRSWTLYARDISSLLDALPKNSGAWRLAGHSCGAVSATLAARARSDIASLALIEPVVPPPFMHYFAQLPVWMVFASRWKLVKGALGRRAQWRDRADVIDGYSKKALFRSWAPGVLEDYLEDGLTEASGGVRLSCDPRWEAATYQAQRHDFWGAAEPLKGKIAVVAAAHQGSTVSEAAQKRFARSGIVVERLEGVTHLLPMEAPEAAARFVAAAR